MDLDKMKHLMMLTSCLDGNLALEEEDKSLSEKVTTFHISAVILESLLALEDPSYMNLRESLKKSIGVDNPVKIEERLDKYLPRLVAEGFVSDGLVPTELGLTMIRVKKEAFYLADLYPGEEIVN